MDQTQNNSRKLDVLYAFSLRDLVNKANSIHLQKEDIIHMFHDSGEGYYIVYYK